MKLSVITINKNNDVGLKQTIDSVNTQTYHGFEYIIIDGCSTDDSVKVINDFITKHNDFLSVKWVSENDSGIYDAMNKGINMATGDYLLFLNSGDCFASTYVVEKVYEKEFNADIEIASCNMLKKGKIVWTYIPRNHYTYGTLFFYGIAHQSAFINRKLFERYGLYDETYKYNGDIEFWYRTIIDNKVSTESWNYVVTNYSLGGISDVMKNNPVFEEEHKRILSNPLYEKFINDYEEWKRDREWIDRYRIIEKYPSIVHLLNKWEKIKRKFGKHRISI